MALAAAFTALTIGAAACSKTHRGPAEAPGRGGSGGETIVGGNGGAGAAMAAGGVGGVGPGGSIDAASDGSRICGLSGRFAAVNPDGSCPPVSELSKYSPNNNLVFFFGIYSDGSNASVPKCQEMSRFDRGYRFRFHVDQVRLGSRLVESGGQVFDSSILGTDLDADPVCGMGVFLDSKSEQVSLAPGRTLTVARRVVVRSDTDQPGAYVIYDEQGDILYSYATVRVDTFADDLGDLFPNLGIVTSADSICRVPDADMSLVSAHLRTGSNVCDIDSHSERCCTLWGRTYEVQMVAALGPNTNGPYSTVSFALRAPGFFAKGQ